MSMAKVVKVEEVNQPVGVVSKDRVQFVDHFPDVPEKTSSSLLAHGNTETSLVPISSAGIGRVEEDAEGSEAGAEAEEAKDKVYPLPDNWPKIPQILRRRSCELTKTSIPCVNKAVSHLELLQNAIEEWFKEQGSPEPTRPNGSRKELRFHERPRESSALSVQSRASSRLTGSVNGRELTSVLSVQGVGMIEEEHIEDSGVPYLGAEDALDEVITLLARLENDRQETEDALMQERERVVRLGAKIDNLCLKRIEELPKAVQTEHENCIMDLNELQWHVAYSSRNEARIENRTSIAEVLNSRLKEDIAFVQKHIPLVQEKLELELEAMQKIKDAQKDTDQELDTTVTRQEKTEAKSNEAITKAETERGHIKQELDTVRTALTNASEELAEAKMTYNAYIHQINDIEQQLKDNEQELKVLEVKNENAKVAEEMQSIKVQDIQKKIREAEFEHTRLENENMQLQQELNVRKSTFEHKINDLEAGIRHRDSKLRQVVLKNQEVEMEVQDYMEKISDCIRQLSEEEEVRQRQKVSDEKNITRIHKEMQRLAQQMSITNDEYNRVASLHQTIKDQLQTEQDRTFKMEESLKATADTLKKQVKDEVHTKTVLASRIAADAGDLTKTRGDVTVKRQKAQKVADEVMTAVNGVRAKVERLRSAKDENNKKKVGLTEQITETYKQKMESENRFNERLKQIEPHHNHLKEDLLKFNKRLDHMAWQMDLMKNKMEDYDKSQGMMDRVNSQTTKAIKLLEDELAEINVILQSNQRIEDDLRATYQDLTSRLTSNDAAHRKLMEDREGVFRDIKLDKTSRLQANKDFASRYRQLQNDFLIFKEKLLNEFDEKIKLENTIKDCRQLQALQKRMHGAMLEYFKYRGMYNESELHRMNELSNENGAKVADLQEDMDSALEKITDFLLTQMSGDMARKMAWAAVEKQTADGTLLDRSSKRRTKTRTPRQPATVQAQA